MFTANRPLHLAPLLRYAWTMLTRSTLIVSAVSAASLFGCRDQVSASRVAQITDADSLWGGGGFCARTKSGLSCWESLENTLTSNGPTLVEGLDGVRSVALRIGEGCALHAKGVACFRPGEAKSRALAFDNPTQVIATGGYPGLICVLHSDGVTCWGGEIRAPALVPSLGKPNKLVISANGGVLCGIHTDGPRCYEINAQGKFSEGIRLQGVKDLRGLMLSTIGGDAYVLDGTTMAYATFAGTLRVGNPFAARNPLEVDVSIRPFTGATSTPQPIPGLGPVRSIANWSIWPLVLDDLGVLRLDHHGGSFDNTRWPIEGGVPARLWSGYKDVFYTRDGDTLHERTRVKSGVVDRLVEGVTKPLDVAVDTYFTCVLEETGGVACLRSAK